MMKDFNDKARMPVAPAPDIATKAELLMRLRARPIPHCEMSLTPRGPGALEVRKNINTLSENRINHLETRLQRAKEGFANDHSKAMIKGKAKGDFERKR